MVRSLVVWSVVLATSSGIAACSGDDHHITIVVPDADGGESGQDGTGDAGNGQRSVCAGRGGDDDRDDVCQSVDNCPEVPNPTQRDTDGDGIGDACDPTPARCDDQDGATDGDGICDGVDNCVDEPNATQTDRDGDGIGDACDDEDGSRSAAACAGLGGDADGDDWCALYDNCPNVANPDQTDTNGNGVGDACDEEICNGLDDDGDGEVDNGFPDRDGDGVADCIDRCPNAPDVDADGDGIVDCIDPCPDDPRNDEDADGICSAVDNCPLSPNASQSDRDQDGIGDACDVEVCDGVDNDGDGLVDEGLEDADGDHVCDAIDACPNDPENDADYDGHCADDDNCPAITNEDQEDADGDGWGDACDLDSASACGESAPLGSDLIPAGLATRFMVVDPARDLVYVTVGNSAGAPHANEFVAIDPASRTIRWSVLVGSGPRPIALSDDGSRAYVGMDATGQVRVIDLERRSACFQFALGNVPNGGARYAYDMLVLPGHPETLVASNRLQGSTGFGGLFVYDNGAPRRDSVSSDAYLIAPAGGAEFIYALNNQSTEFGLRRIAIDASGARQIWVQRDLVSGFASDIDYVGGRIYATTGVVLDPVFPKILGQFPSSGPIAVDAGRNEAFIAAAVNRVDVYDTNTFLLLRRLTITPASNNAVGQIARWGASGLVMRHENGLTFASTE